MAVVDSEAVTSTGREMFGSPSSSLSSEMDEERTSGFVSDETGIVLAKEGSRLVALLAMLFHLVAMPSEMQGLMPIFIVWVVYCCT